MRFKHLTAIFKKLKYFFLQQYVIRNKFGALYQFLLGKNSIIIELIDGSSISVSRDLFREIIRNINKISNIEFKQGDLWINCGQLPISMLNALPELLSGMICLCEKDWSYSDGVWVNKNMGLRFARIVTPSWCEVFHENIYECDVKGREVIDAGAGFGDSTIYFAYRGASKVIAIEPVPTYVELIKENIRLNNLEDRVIILNAALSSKADEKIEVPLVPTEHYVYNFTIYRARKIPKNTLHNIKVFPTTCINTVSLSDIVNLLSDPNNAILKMDCEGCEYDIILNDYEHVRIFKELIFEYHEIFSGIPKERLLQVLAKDFNCRIIRDGYIGLVKCIRLEGSS